MRQNVAGRIAAVIAVASIPFGCHFGVLLLQASFALLMLDGGVAANRDVAAAVAFGWTLVAGIVVASQLGLWQRLVESVGVGRWWARVRLRELVPFVWMFVGFATFDVVIQGLASRAFGVDIPWLALMARIPILYLAISIPSLGNFGTREIAWSQRAIELTRGVRRARREGEELPEPLLHEGAER